MLELLRHWIQRLQKNPPLPPSIAERSDGTLTNRYQAVSRLMSEVPYALYVNLDKSIHFDWILGAPERVVGYPLESVIKMGGWESIVHPQDISLYQQHIQTVIERKEHTAEFRVNLPNQAILWLRDMAQCLRSPNGEVFQIQGVLQNITERVENEKKQRDFSNGLRDAVTMLVSERDLSLVLDKVLEYLIQVIVPQAKAGTIVILTQKGVKIASQLGHNHTSFYPEIEQTLSESKKYEIIKQTLVPIVIDDVTQDPAWKITPTTAWIRSYLGVPIVANGVCLGFINLDSDLIGMFTNEDAERVKAFADKAAIAILNAQRSEELEQKVHERTLELEAEKAQQARFIANAAHELRTPITNLNTRLYLMQRQPNEMPTHLDSLERVIKRMNRLVSDLLDLANFEHGEIRLNKQSVILQTVVDDVVAIQIFEAEQKHIVISVHYPELPVALVADSPRLQQVITNIVANAIIYTPEGGEIRITLKDDGQNASIHIQDTGQGMAAESTMHIFEPFYRIETRQTGTGLGLSIAYEIVKNHQGRLEVESEIGKGSTFIIILPKAQV